MTAPPATAPASAPRLELRAASRWFGDVVAVNDVSMSLGPGVTGLLGPNGAGKSTLLHLMSGFLAPSAGEVLLDGRPLWRDESVYRDIGLVPEREDLPDRTTCWRFVLDCARLHRLPRPEDAARAALEQVDMLAVADRRLGACSKGMRQRVKMASALVHDPGVLLLDEPFNGMDPRQRLHLVRVLRRLGAEGRTVVVSSHVLEEVEDLADRVEVVVAGRHAASGGYRALRRLMTARPHRYALRSSDDRALAAALLADPSTTAASLQPGGGALLEVRDVERFATALPALAVAAGARLDEVVPTDDSLESVFAYLVAR